MEPRPETRPLTDAERRYLEWWLKSGLLTTGPSAKDKIFLSTYAAGCLTGITYFLMAIVLKILTVISATAVAAKAFRKSPEKGYIIAGIAVVFWIGMLVYFFVVRRRKPGTEMPDPKKTIEQDLAEGVARIHRLRATAVIVAHSDRRKRRTYFVRLDDGRILILGEFRPMGCAVKGLSFLPDEKGFPSITFEIAATPNDLLILDVVGTGEFLRPEDEFELSEDPDTDLSRLEPGGLVDVPWDEIKKTFG
jgi:hypothetical protein